jgi:histidinol-phosphate aminotransferase
MRQRLACANPSEGNFLYVHTNLKSEVVVERLQRRGIVVRDCGSFPGSGEHCLRVTVGRPEENDRFLEEFENADRLAPGACKIRVQRPG